MSMQPLVETLVLRAALDEINGAQSLHAIMTRAGPSTSGSRSRSPEP